MAQVTKKKKKKKSKYNVKRIVICALIFCAIITGIVILICVAGKNKGDNNKSNTNSPIDVNDYINDGEYVVINADDCSLYVGSKATLTCSSHLSDDEKDVVWITNNPDVVTVDYMGNIEVMSAGMAVITATKGALSDSVIINAIEKKNENPTGESVPDEIETIFPIYEVGTAGEIIPPPTTPSQDNPATKPGGSETEKVTKPNDNPEKPTKEPDWEPTQPVQTQPVHTEPEQTEPEQESVPYEELVKAALTANGFTKYQEQTYVFNEDGNYLGQVVVNPDNVHIYVKMRTRAFDAAISNLITVLLPNQYNNVFTNFITAKVDQTYYSEGHRIRIVLSVNESHAQLIISY